MKNNQNKSIAGKIILLIFLILIILAGIFGTLCGGFLTLSEILNPSDSYLFQNIYSYSIPSLVIGLLALGLGIFLFKKILVIYKEKILTIKKSLFYIIVSIVGIVCFYIFIFYIYSIIEKSSIEPLNISSNSNDSIIKSNVK